ncbi:MAG: type II toxin-antitoxin system CcdA family antitoxin [Spirochaeta sp.]|jgi:antitoxin CcdA|nr:type II toxin-antitoxin system CcdA family antitoxin [Spirochaeta sp.]
MKEHTKRRTNVSIDSDLFEAARARGMKLSSLLEVAIREKLRQAASEQWLEENREAIRTYKRESVEHGVFSDGLRSF